MMSKSCGLYDRPLSKGAQCTVQRVDREVQAPAPNPDPARWRLLRKHQYPHAYVLIVRYLDCTNFEGLKVMVYLGRYLKRPERLDPHFAKTDDSPIARFKPDAQGIALAKALAGSAWRPGK